MNQQNSTILPPLQAFDALASFLREFLVCDDHQLTTLTLWIAHTWCFDSFREVPYLDIRSPQPQSGKTTCLRLLDVVCCNTALVTGAAPDVLKYRLLYGRSVAQIKRMVENPEQARKQNQHWVHTTFLIDDYQHSFTASERQALIAILNCGTELAARYSYRDDDYFVTAPKAFAGNTPLPESLASRCIPIILRRAKFSEPVKRFFPDDLEPLTASFRAWLENWAKDAAPRLQEARDKSVQLPPALTPRQRQCAEPLLRIANQIGGPWPAMAREALAAAFSTADYSHSIQLLRDTRTFYLKNNQPKQMPTRDLLIFLSSLDNRPWSTWSSKSGQRLASLLHSWGIFSHDIRVGEESLKGYYSQEFQDAWERYAGPVAAFAAAEKNAATT
jgi:hypothetical protein